jgi:hypothetical protein
MTPTPDPISGFDGRSARGARNHSISSFSSLYFLPSFILCVCLHFLVFSCILPYVSLRVHVFVFKGLDTAILSDEDQDMSIWRVSAMYFCIVLTLRDFYEWNECVNTSGLIVKERG